MNGGEEGKVRKVGKSTADYCAPASSTYPPKPVFVYTHPPSLVNGGRQGEGRQAVRQVRRWEGKNLVSLGVSRQGDRKVEARRGRKGIKVG